MTNVVLIYYVAYVALLVIGIGIPCLLFLATILILYWRHKKLKERRRRLEQRIEFIIDELVENESENEHHCSFSSGDNSSENNTNIHISVSIDTNTNACANVTHTAAIHACGDTMEEEDPLSTYNSISNSNSNSNNKKNTGSICAHTNSNNNHNKNNDYNSTSSNTSSSSSSSSSNTSSNSNNDCSKTYNTESDVIICYNNNDDNNNNNRTSHVDSSATMEQSAIIPYNNNGNNSKLMTDWSLRNYKEINRLLTNNHSDLSMSNSNHATHVFNSDNIIVSYLRNLPVAPCLMMLQYLEIRLSGVSRLRLLYPVAVERLLMKQLFGVFVRNGERLLYLIFPHIDLTSIHHSILEKIPHCLRLADVQSMDVQSWKWSTRSWHTGKYNKSLVRFHGLTTLHLCNEQVERELAPAIRTITDLGMEKYDPRVLPHIARVTRLKIGSIFPSYAMEMFLATNILPRLKHLNLYKVERTAIELIVSRMEHLETLYVFELENFTSLLDRDWNRNSQLKRITFYRSLNASVHIPFHLSSLECVKLGLGIRLQPSSLDINLFTQDTSSIKSLSIVEEVPNEFLNPSFLYKLLPLEKLSLTISNSAIPLLSQLSLLSNLKALQLRCSDSSFNLMMENTVKNELLGSNMPRLTHVLLCDCHLYTRVKGNGNHNGLMPLKNRGNIIQTFISNGNSRGKLEDHGSLGHEVPSVVWNMKRLNKKKHDQNKNSWT
jgi:hypothetical protein